MLERPVLSGSFIVSKTFQRVVSMDSLTKAQCMESAKRRVYLEEAKMPELIKYLDFRE